MNTDILLEEGGCLVADGDAKERDCFFGRLMGLKLYKAHPSKVDVGISVESDDGKIGFLLVMPYCGAFYRRYGIRISRDGKRNIELDGNDASKLFALIAYIVYVMYANNPEALALGEVITTTQRVCHEVEHFAEIIDKIARFVETGDVDIVKLGKLVSSGAKIAKKEDI